MNAARKPGAGLAAAVLILISLVLTANATAVRPPKPPKGDMKVAALTKQVAKLTLQVKTLQAQVRQTQEQARLNAAGITCLGAMQADALQGTWAVIDEIALATQGKTYFAQEAPVSDYLNCAILGQEGVPRPGIEVPPTIRVFDALMLVLHIE